MKTQQQPSNVPLTVASSQSVEGSQPNVAIGQNLITPTSQSGGSYWFLVVDRTTLEIVANVFSADPDSVPAAVAPYVNSPNFLLILSTWGVTINNVPQGPLYDLLVAAGAGPALSRLEQLNEQLSCGLFGLMSYAMAGVLGGGQSLSACEAGSIAQVTGLGAVLTAQLIPTVENGVFFYTPMETEG